MPAKGLMNAAILGPGGIGGFLATLLSKSGVLVTCVVKPGFAFKALHLASPVFGTIDAPVHVAYSLDHPIDTLFITTKSTDLRDAISKISLLYVKNAVIIPLLNGLGHMQILREMFGSRVAVGMIGAIEAKSETPGYITHLSKTAPVLELASLDVPEERLQEVATILRSAGITVRVLDREAEVIWNKLVRLNAIASVTAAAQKPLGQIRTDSKWRPLLEGSVEEAAAVAAKEGVRVNPGAIMQQIDALPEELTTSLQRDVAKGVPSEVEAIPGGVLKAAATYNLSCPSIEKLYRMIKAVHG